MYNKNILYVSYTFIDFPMYMYIVHVHVLYLHVCPAKLLLTPYMSNTKIHSISSQVLHRVSLRLYLHHLTSDLHVGNLPMGCQTYIHVCIIDPGSMLAN